MSDSKARNAAISARLQEKYPPQELFDYYLKYKETKDEFFRESLVGRCNNLFEDIFKYYRSTTSFYFEGMEEDARQSALIKIWDYMDREMLPEDDPIHFFAWMWKVCRGEFFREKKRYSVRTYDFSEKVTKVPHYHHLTNKEIENFLFVKEIRQAVYNDVLACVRFEGNEFEACKNLLNKIVNQLEIEEKHVSKTYEIPLDKIRFFRDYVTVLARLDLYRIRKGNQMESGWVDSIYDSDHIYMDPADIDYEKFERS